MTAIMIVSGLFALAALVATVLPFFVGRGGFLAAAGTINDPARLESMKAAIVARYVKEELVFSDGDLSRRDWARRQEYLRQRYIDVARRGSESPGVWEISAPVGVGEPLAFEVVGVAEGRQRLWIMGISVASLLIGLGGGLAWWGRPKRKEEFINEEALGS